MSLDVSILEYRTSVVSIQNAMVSFNRMLFRRELRATKTVILCISLFALTWLPHVILIMVCQFGNGVYEEFINPVTLTLPSLFVKTSTIFNPLIYTLVNPECKLHIKRIFGIKVISRWKNYFREKKLFVFICNIFFNCFLFFCKIYFTTLKPCKYYHIGF